MNKKFGLIDEKDKIEVTTTDEGQFFIEINYEADTGDGERGDAILLDLDEFNEFIAECRRMAEYVKERGS
jgi:hypothetical protein